MGSKVIPIWKPVSLTPLEAVQQFKTQNPPYRSEKISYAGRLDPMAEGVLLFLIGEENKKRKEYEKLKKTYKAEVLFGVETDSFDGMGVIEGVSLSQVQHEKIEKELQDMVGVFDQKYPPYSSRTVQGKALYWWTRQNKLAEISIPSKSIEIISISEITFKTHAAGEIANNLVSKINKVNGDFRQKEIIAGWQEFAENHPAVAFPSVSFEIAVSSGAYIRSLASELGKKAGSGGFLLNLTRTSVGEYACNDCVIIEK